VAISQKKAREIASDWHGGQSSHLYVFASSGAAPKPSELIEEIRFCMTDAARENDQLEVERLFELWVFVISHFFEEE
jgi:hypothetical protein